MSLPSISVIFLSYKQEAYVVAALRAVLEQDLPDYEIIIGDDASLVGASTPTTRTVIFRIWDSSSASGAANLLYSERQTVTIFKGEFSVLVGTGDAVTGSPRNFDEVPKKLASLADPALWNSSTRFLGVTVCDAGTDTGTDHGTLADGAGDVDGGAEVGVGVLGVATGAVGILGVREAEIGLDHHVEAREAELGALEGLGGGEVDGQLLEVGAVVDGRDRG